MTSVQMQRNILLAIDTIRKGRVEAGLRILERVADQFDDPIEFNVTDDALLEWLS